MPKTQSKMAISVAIISPWAITVLFTLFFISGFTALLYQVAWQRMLGLCSSSIHFMNSKNNSETTPHGMPKRSSSASNAYR